MAGLKLTILFLFVNVICISVARIIGPKSLAERTSKMLKSFPRFPKRTEADADAMYQATSLRWRPNAAKISFLVTDAPKHVLVSSGDSFPSGCPRGHVLIDIARKLAKRGITLYTVECEPSVVPHTYFFMALAYLTGGQNIPLSVHQFLDSAIIAGAKEELSLKKFSADVKTEVKQAISAGGFVNGSQITQSVLAKLKSEGATAQQLLKNNHPLGGVTAQAKATVEANSLADAEKLFTPRLSSGGRFGRSVSDIRRKVDGGRRISSGIRCRVDGGRRISSCSRRRVDGGRRKSSGSRRRVGGSRRTSSGSQRRVGGGRRTSSGSRRRMGGSRRTSSGSRRRVGGGRRTSSGSRRRVGSGRRISSDNRRRLDGIRPISSGIRRRVV